MIKVRQIRIDVREDNVVNLKNKLLKKLRIEDKDLIDFKIIKKSIDARDKNNVLYVYEVNVELLDEKKVLVVMDELTEQVILASRNLQNVLLMEPVELNVLDIVNADVLLMDKQAVKDVEEALK